MKILGNILHISGSGKLIVRTSNMPPAGAFVFTNDKNKIGRVGGIFGPVKNPYVSVNIYKSINKRDLENRCGEKLFVSTKRENERFKRSNSKNSSKKSKNKFKNSNKSKGNKNKRNNKSSIRKNRKNKSSTVRRIKK